MYTEIGEAELAEDNLQAKGDQVWYSGHPMCQVSEQHAGRYIH